MVCGKDGSKPVYSDTTAEAIGKFLKLLAIYGNVTHAANEAKIDRVYLYRLRKKDPDLDKRWAEAEAIGIKGLEDECRRRAYSGWDEPVYQGGIEVGSKRKHSDALAMFLLKGALPKKYADHSHVQMEGNMNSRIEISSPKKVAQKLIESLDEMDDEEDDMEQDI